jgi:NAD+ synthase (glutamine-hydrolysing)
MKIALCQINPVVGDVSGNVANMLEIIDSVRADVIVFPELSVTGYPPRDLLCHPDFLVEAGMAADKIVAATRGREGVAVIFGCPVLDAPYTHAYRAMYNSAITAEDGKWSMTHKALLPSYDVFDEARYFTPARREFANSIRPDLGVTICEDAWSDPEFWPDNQAPYDFDPVESRVRTGAKVLINISASPFNVGKPHLRYQLISKHSRKHQRPFVYVNQVGGNDELVFDGRSMVFNEFGYLIHESQAFGEQISIVDTETATPVDCNVRDDVDEVIDAVTLGIRDYFRKCGFERAVIGLSGGIDSAVTAAFAVKALGPKSVFGITMPSRFNDPRSKAISDTLAKNLGIEVLNVPISKLYAEYCSTFESTLFRGAEQSGVAFENIQARIRGNLLMAFSNKYGNLVISTGNKSELAVGYCTLYGDMCGGLAAISDVPKTMVYDIARRFNKNYELIPTWIIDRPPSAELRDDQCDQDTLPAYDVLDGILKAYLEEGKPPAMIVMEGYQEKDVNWVVRAVAKNEYKRRQAAPGLRVTTKAFGVGRRYPIAAKVVKDLARPTVGQHNSGSRV